MRTFSFSIGVGLAVAACTVEKHTPSTRDTTTVASGAPAAKAPSVDTPAAGATPTASTWTVTPSGIGPLRVGMSVDDLRRVGGDFAMPAGGASECSYVRPASAPHGVSVMLARGQVARVDVDSAGVQSDAGVAVGDSASRVSQAYTGRVTATPHKYVPGGQYLTVRPISPQDSSMRIVFETEAGRVTRFRSGRVPEVSWVERCG